MIKSDPCFFLKHLENHDFRIQNTLTSSFNTTIRSMKIRMRQERITASGLKIEYYFNKYSKIIGYDKI